MKTNVQITAVKKEFKNGQNGYEVKVEGMDGKLDCRMNFYEPLKAMRYMFMLSTRLELQIDSVQLAALSMAYQRAKDAMQSAVDSASLAVNEFPGAEQVLEESAPEVVSEPSDNLSLSLSGQYDELKAKHPDALLLFRCGDFYESYHEDAQKVADSLGLTLTKRSQDGVYMAGFPYHALDTYLPRLVRKGYRVAICDKIPQVPVAHQEQNDSPSEAPAPKKRGRKPASK